MAEKKPKRKPRAPRDAASALQTENSRLRKAKDGLKLRLEEAEETLRAIREGEVDALVVEGPDGDQIFTLQGAEAPYRFLVEEMNEGALLLGLDGTILYANARFAVLAGLPLNEVIGACWEHLFNPAQQPDLHSLLGNYKAGGVRREFDLKTPQGSRPVEVSVASLKRQTLQGFSVVVTDLSERKTAEEALRASNAKLREMVAELEHFSYSIGHDMRAPLRAMKSFAALLEDNETMAGQPENRDLLRRISAAASRLDSLIQGSLDYARVIKRDVSAEQVNLDRLLRDLVESYPNLLPSHAEIELEPNLPVVLGNEAGLTQVFSNLLGNAVKFVKPGVRPRIRVWSEVRDQHARVWVEDNGIGIEPDAQARIFELFQRAHRAYEGTGIGLAVVRKIVTQMGGSAGVESEPGKGSRFWVELRKP
jgi:PAS domain S-box-containing protein